MFKDETPRQAVAPQAACPKASLQTPEFIACEVHDGPCQYLATAKTFFHTFHREAELPAGASWQRFEQAMAYLNRAADELRRIVDGLLPAQLEGRDLPEAIRLLIAEVQADGGPEIEFCHDLQEDQSRSLSPAVELVVFRIIQECLTNACRHSKSRTALVGLTLDSGTLTVQVQDWGVGLPPDGFSPGGFGLKGICRRAESLGGITSIQSHPGRGTCITVELPLALNHAPVVQSDPTEG